MTSVTSLEEVRQAYAKARQAVWGSPRHVNVAPETKRRMALEQADAAEAAINRREGARLQKERATAESEYAKMRRRIAREKEMEKRPRPPIADIVAALPEQASMAVLAQVVLGFFEGLTLNDIRADERKSYVAYARHCVASCLWLRKRNLNAVGRFLCRDHTSILHSVRKMGVHIAVRSAECAK